jgi:chromosome segregation ATPase
MTDDLVKRLREHVTDIRNFRGNVMTAWDLARSMTAKGNTGSLPRDIIESYLEGYAEDMQTAADRIEQLQDMIEVMQHELKELQWSLDCKDDLHKQDYDRMKKYADRIEQLEAALREIVDRAEHRMGHAVSDDVCVIARKALEGKDG